MKTFIFCLLGVFFLEAQVPKVVYDPTQAINMGKQIQSANAQLTQLNRTVEHLEKAENTLTKVSGYVRNIEDIKEIYRLQKETIENAIKVKSRINKVKSNNMKNLLSKTTSTSLSSINNSIVYINSILKNNFFKMTDKDRIDLIEKERSKVFFNYTRVEALVR